MLLAGFTQAWICLTSFLLPQLENVLGGDEKFQERVTAHLIPCIAQFSVATADDSLWKPLNYQILLKTRHTSPKVGSYIRISTGFLCCLRKWEQCSKNHNWIARSLLKY